MEQVLDLAQGYVFLALALIEVDQDVTQMTLDSIQNVINLAMVCLSQCESEQQELDRVYLQAKSVNEMQDKAKVAINQADTFMIGLEKLTKMPVDAS